MKFLNVEIEVDTFINISNLFWHGNMEKKEMKISGVEQGFKMGLFERTKKEGVKPIALSEKGYVMARAHFYIERTSLLELEKALFEAQTWVQDKELDSGSDKYNANRYEDEKDG